MKKTFIIANWKSHKTTQEASAYMTSFFSKEFSEYVHTAKEVSQKTVIFCPPFTLLESMSQFLKPFKHESISIKLGAQNISPFEDGAYTGEESGRMLKEFADYVIIGHTERRIEFNEEEDLLQKKVEVAKAANIEPIYCVPNNDSRIPPGVLIVAYEPKEAIGTGEVEDIKEVEKIAQVYKEKGVHYFLYGGSVTSDTVSNYTQNEFIDGVLVGGASLDPQEFSQIVLKA